MLKNIRLPRVWLTIVVLTAALAFPVSVLGGGWAVVTLDRLPERVMAGQPYTVGMMAQQHGVSPLQADSLTIQAWLPETGQKVTFTAKPDHPMGHYQAELLFPQPGRWEWGVQSGLYPDQQPMPALMVESGGAAAVPPDDRVFLAGLVNRFGLPQILRASALAALAVGAVLVVRGRKQRYTLLGGIGLLILCGGLAIASFSVSKAQAKAGFQAVQVPVTASLGRDLFLAKGCVVCHVNNRAINGSEQYSVSMGPDLSAYHNDPAYLRQWLKEPRSLKPETAMPNLKLEAEEIDALVEFINASGD